MLGAATAPPFEPPQADGTPSWARKRVTFLRALGDAGEAVLAPQLELLEEKVDVFGGRVIARDPRGLLGVFGLDAVEDGARRAVLAAVTALRSGASGLRFGVAVGDIAVMRDATDLTMGPEAVARGYELVGDIVGGGGVCVSEAAAQVLRRHFRVGSRGGRSFVDQDLSSAPVQVSARMVGREGELRLLATRAEALAEGTAQIAAVVGPPGIGKSRLVAEVRAQLGTERFWVIEAHCAAHAMGIPYFPVAAVLRRLAGLSEADDLARCRERLLELARGHGVDPENVPYLLHVLGGDEAAAGVGAQTVRARAFDAVRELLLRAAARRPLIVVIEDVHWADDSSRAVLEHVVEGMARSRLMLLVTYRPGGAPVFMARETATRIALAPLSSLESRGLVAALLAEESAPDADRIVDRAEGNPLFLEELALAVRGGGRLAAIPDSIHGILALRIERLGPGERRVLGVASVLGRAFPRALLEAVWDLPQPLGPALEALDAADLLYRDTGALVFKHALTRDAAYDALVESERVRLHERAASALEETHRGKLDEVCELIAYHHSRGSQGDKAVELLAMAQEKAYRRFALEQSAAYCREALARLDALPETDERLRRRLSLLVRHADVLGYLARSEEMEGCVDLMDGIARRLDDPALMASVGTRRGFILMLCDKYEAAARVLEASLVHADQTNANAAAPWLMFCYALLGRHAIVVDQASADWAARPPNWAELGSGSSADSRT
jgi:hypothetical protein